MFYWIIKFFDQKLVLNLFFQFTAETDTFNGLIILLSALQCNKSHRIYYFTFFERQHEKVIANVHYLLVQFVKKYKNIRYKRFEAYFSDISINNNIFSILRKLFLCDNIFSTIYMVRWDGWILVQSSSVQIPMSS